MLTPLVGPAPLKPPLRSANIAVLRSLQNDGGHAGFGRVARARRLLETPKTGRLPCRLLLVRATCEQWSPDARMRRRSLHDTPNLSASQTFSVTAGVRLLGRHAVPLNHCEHTPARPASVIFGHGHADHVFADLVRLGDVVVGSNCRGATWRGSALHTLDAVLSFASK